MSIFKTAESVSPKHPDKICDQISDAILDAHLTEDPDARVAVDVAGGHGKVFVTGEVTSKARNVDVAAIVKRLAGNVELIEHIAAQSPEIAQGVDTGGAGDQGIMVGYATNETAELLPLEFVLARKLNQYLYAVWPYDGKTQVTLEYENDVPVRIDAVVVSSQHNESVKYKTLREAVIELVIDKVLPKKLVDKNTKFHVNPTGRFVIGGPLGDCGLTGRKIIVDTYGGMGRHGGGAFSGKDPSKVDRSACYYARYIAKNIVAAGLAKRCEVQVAYAIGVARPVGVRVDTFGTGKVSDERLEKYVHEHFDMRPKALIDELGLLKPQYQATAAYGHFGRSEFSWEKTNRAAVMAADLLGGKVKGTKVAFEENGNGHGHATASGSVATSKKTGKKDKKSKKSKKETRAEL